MTAALFRASEILDMALQIERLGIAFYRMIKDRVRDSEGEAIEDVIREERRHIERLNDLRRKLDGRSTAAGAD